MHSAVIHLHTGVVQRGPSRGEPITMVLTTTLHHIFRVDALAVDDMLDGLQVATLAGVQQSVF